MDGVTRLPAAFGWGIIDTLFYLAVFLAAVFSGATASLVGFGIGSVLTPLLAVHVGTNAAVAAVSLPHALATAVRGWRLRGSIDWPILTRFGLLSAAGALGGALLYTSLGPTALTRVLGGLLVLTAFTQLTGWSSHWQPRGPLVAVFGLMSGFFGGVAGNQGGLRSAAMLAFDLAPLRFVATATATGVLVDMARTPIYLWYAGSTIASLWVPISVAAAGVLAGTLLGERILLGLSPHRFGQVVALAVGVLGVWLLVYYQ
jgi:uncharacterized membrane protein YfcA